MTKQYDIDFKFDAKYTMVWSDWLDKYPEFWGSVITPNLTGWSEKDCEEFVKVFNGIWGMYEVNAETYESFVIRFAYCRDEWSAYYKEFLDAYHKKIDMLQGKNTKGKTKYYELPNKTINGGVGNLTSQTEYENSGSDDVIDLKRRYLNLIKDVYRQMAMKFTDLFIHIF